MYVAVDKIYGSHCHVYITVTQLKHFEGGDDYRLCVTAVNSRRHGES